MPPKHRDGDTVAVVSLPQSTYWAIEPEADTRWYPDPRPMDLPRPYRRCLRRFLRCLHCRRRTPLREDRPE